MHILHIFHTQANIFNMKVYFTCSTAKFEKYKKNYYRIRDYLVSQKHILTRDWLSLANNRIKKNKVEFDDMNEIYNACIKALNSSELVIVEDTVSNFSTGHQITLALQRQKPTLVLWQGKKHRHFKKMFIHGVKSDFLEVKTYTKNNFTDVIEEFIEKYRNSYKKNRFHLVLNQVERDYLDWLQFNKNISRTRAIRDYIREALDNDEDYSNYLKEK